MKLNEKEICIDKKMKSSRNSSQAVLGLFLSLCLMLSLIMSGCSYTALIKKQYLGKQVSLSNYKRLENSGQHLWHTEHFDIVYDYIINDTAQTITLEGTFTYNVPYGKRKYRSEQVLLEYDYFTFILLFANDSGVIVGVESARLKPKGSLVDPFDFKVTVPYNSIYTHISCLYKAGATGT
jgi:hypothetical protein